MQGMDSLGRRIRIAREAANPRIKQVDLARQLGVSKDEMWRIENDRSIPTDDMLRKIATITGASLVISPSRVPAPTGTVYEKSQAAPGPVATPSNARVIIVVSRWNEAVTKMLLEGAEEEIVRARGGDVEVHWVPGTWEIPIMVRHLLTDGKGKPDLIVALGCILQGETPHAQLLGRDVSGALMQLQMEYGVPIGWGILTPDTMEQAFERAGMKLGNKGREAAQAALEVARKFAESTGAPV